MTPDNDSRFDQINFRKLTVKSESHKFEIGDFVKPDTIVGLNVKTGQPVKAEIHGRIVTMQRNAANGSVMMLIVSDND